MDNFSDDIKSILEIEENDKVKFRTIEISSDKTAYLAVRESEKIMFGKLTSLSLEPVALIIKRSRPAAKSPVITASLEKGKKDPATKAVRSMPQYP